MAGGIRSGMIIACVEPLFDEQTLHLLEGAK